MSELKIENLLQINDEPVINFDELSEEKKKEYGRLLNKQAMEAIGYREVVKNCGNKLNN